MSDQEFKLKNVLSKEQIKALLKAHTKSQLLEKAIAWEITAGQYKKQLDDLQEDFASMDGVDLEEYQKSVDKKRVEEFFNLNKDELQNEQDNKEES